MLGKNDRDIITSQMQIVNEVTGGWKSQVLFTLLKIGIFDALDDNPKDIQSLAHELQIPSESLKRLLACSVSLGFLSKKDDLYVNSDLVSKVLVNGKPSFMGNWILLCAKWYDSFGKLDKAIQTNQAVEDINYTDDPKYKDLFINGMIDYAQYRGSDVLNFLDLKDKKQLLDVGSGPSVYAAMFCERYPDLQVTCLDLPHALEIAKRYLAERKVKERINLVESDYKQVSSFGNGFDVVFMSHVLHQESEEVCLQILDKSYQALQSSGLLVVQAMFPDEKESNSYTLLHDLLSLLIFPGGKNYTISKTKHWLEEVGFRNVRYQRMSLFNINSLVIGEKN